MHLFDH